VHKIAKNARGKICTPHWSIHFDPYDVNVRHMSSTQDRANDDLSVAYLRAFRNETCSYDQHGVLSIIDFGKTS
jgi:hypothetical protein